MNKENYQIIREIAYNLPNPDRDIIMLYLGFYYGKSYNKNEIADMLSISQSTVSKLIGKNLKIIKKHLIKEGLIKEEIKNIKEIREYLEEHPGITSYCKIYDKMQTTGGKIGSYLQEYKEEIIEISKENSDAKYICDYFGWNITKEDILKEIREYLEEYPGITSYTKIDDKMQITGSKIGSYLSNNKEKIINMSDENSDAKYICDYFGWNITKEDILKKIREYLEEHPGITNFRKIDYKIQTTGGKIGNYLFYKKEEIKKISNENSDAKYICDYFGWLEKKATIEDILKEIKKYLEEYPGITSYRKIDDKMQTTGGKIGNYLSNNKEKIKEISNENSDAKYICDYFKWIVVNDELNVDYNYIDDQIIKDNLKIKMMNKK